MNVKEVLISARNLIANPKNWIQRNSAMTSNGTTCNSNSPNAVCWCSYGALNNVSKKGFDVNSKATEALQKAALKLFGTLNVAIDVNDNLGHEAVISMYAQAIEDC